MAQACAGITLFLCHYVAYLNPTEVDIICICIRLKADTVRKVSCKSATY